MWEKVFITTLRRMIRKGSLTLHLPDGRSAHFGDGTGSNLTVRLSDTRLFRDFVINPELAIGEAYTRGTLQIDGDDLYGLHSLGSNNLTFGRGQGAERMTGYLLRRLKQFNPISRAQKNVAHHYDISRDLYEQFLDADMQYSCGYFRKPTDTLELAQEQKKTHIARKLCLKPGLRVLDIGCGWGGMAITLARDYGVKVTGVTLSEGQHKTARERVAAAGLTDQIDIQLTDYRNVETEFDRIVSVGMFEHVGVPHYREFFRHIRTRLNKDGVALIHTIGRTAPPGRTSPWFDKYIFPGGYAPSLSEVAPSIEKENLRLTDLEVWRLHYAETIKHWHDRFVANADKLSDIYDAEFRRMWRFYLVASEQTFRFGRQVVFQFQLTHDQSAAPLTRDYMYETGTAKPDTQCTRPDSG